MSARSSHLRSASRADAIRRVVFELAERRAAGERVSEAALLDEHPELMPELAEEVGKLRSIEQVLDEADSARYSQMLRRMTRESDDLVEASADSSGRENSPASLTAAASGLPARIGRYRVRHLLGEGAFGCVYLAWDEELAREVAIKTPHPQQLPDLEQVEDYLAEARLVARLDHPSVIPVYDIGRTEEGRCYVVSKWIRGSDLQLRMSRERIPRAEAVRIVSVLADALDHAHNHGLVHRDVKPANILLDARGTPYIGDFGLALSGQRLGGGRSFAGTPAYMSPEQARGEAHRVDGRSDVFSLGVVLYELLAGVKPFRSDSYDELLRQILEDEPVALEKRDASIAPELARICGKALAKRAADRYPTGRALADDLRHYLDQTARQRLLRGIADPGDGLAVLAQATAEVSARMIVPKGLRPFEASDSESFLALVPGPRDRDGLPESIRQWKARIECHDPEESFAVGVLYGPTGSGKSSLVRAALLPRLASHVQTLYLEATAEHTEERLVRRLLDRFPELPRGANLAEALGALRCGSGPAQGSKLLVVIDQFEQWLHGRTEADRRTLVHALRQCDGQRLQCLLLVRDDFWLALSRFLGELEVDLIPRRNVALVDLFDPEHARQVLAEFGRAFGQLPEDLRQLSAAQRTFLQRAIEGLTHEDKVVAVRLVLFAEMVKTKPWLPATLRDLGGPAGVGVAFLEETFSDPSAAPHSRAHEVAARAVLEALLPEMGRDMKGRVRSYPELLDLSGYGKNPRAFKELMRILDGETRLITPIDPQVAGDGHQGTGRPGQRYYQLTHDYLVASLRQWLTKKHKSTRAGRSELRLLNRSVIWSAHPERRHLPSLGEWIGIRFLTHSERWTDVQRQMMRAAARHHALLLTLGALLLVALLVGGSEGGLWGRRLWWQFRARSAPLCMTVGYDEAVWPLLKGEDDPTLRTRVLHDLDDIGQLPKILERLPQQAEPSVRRGMLLVAGQWATRHWRPDEPSRRSLTEEDFRRLWELYRDDPDPGLHGAAEWTLRQLGRPHSTQELARAGTRGDRQWYVNGQGQTLLVIIPLPTSFLRGNNEAAKTGAPPRVSRIRRSYSIASTETTVEQFRRFQADRDWAKRVATEPHDGASNLPQSGVRWYEAAAYCNWLSQSEGLPPQEWCYLPNAEGRYAAGMRVAPDWLDRRGYRLPSEAEWEYACRAGAKTAYAFGEDVGYLSQYAAFANPATATPREVGEGKPNDFGLFDMHGNAAEWCQDRFVPFTANDGGASAPQHEQDLIVDDVAPRVLRGGSFADPPSCLRSDARAQQSPSQRSPSVGFRVARSYP